MKMMQWSIRHLAQAKNPEQRRRHRQPSRRQEGQESKRSQKLQGEQGRIDVQPFVQQQSRVSQNIRGDLAGRLAQIAEILRKMHVVSAAKPGQNDLDH